MNNSFISIVGVLNAPYENYNLSDKLLELGKNLYNHFQDFEIIIVNNIPELSPNSEISKLPASVKKSIHLLNLSGKTNRNHAILAGLDRSNGDYTFILETQFLNNFKLVLDLYRKSQEGFDLVYVRNKNNAKKPGLLKGFFYFIFRNWSNIKLDPYALDTRIISRRALNSLLRLRENLRYMKPVYSIIGFKTDYLEIPSNELEVPNESLGEQFKIFLVAVTSFTTFLRSVSLWIFCFSLLAVIAVIINAFKVKFTNYDLFGIYHEALSGWAFTVVIISVFFSITSLNLFIVSIYLSNIYQEIKKRPLYILESVQRF